MRTLSVVRARVGGYVGAGHVHPALLEEVRESVSSAKASGSVDDGYVARCGDALALVLIHRQSPGAPDIRTLAREGFTRAAAVARKLGQHGAPDPSANGGLSGEGAEISFDERLSEPVVCLFTHGAPEGALDLVLYRAFADPFNTPGLLGPLSPGFTFVTEGAGVFDLPEAQYGLLAAIERGGCVTEVVARAGGEVAAIQSTGRDPVLVVRCEGEFPPVGDALEPLASAPLLPVSTTDDGATRTGCPPRVIGLGFQLAEGRLVGPRDLLGDRAFDEARRRCLRAGVRERGPAVAADEPVPVRQPA